VKKELPLFPLRTEWSVEELAYFAGVLDGEGSFSIGGSSRSHIHATQINVGNTDLRLLHWIVERFGGNVHVERRHNPAHAKIWRWYSHVGNLDQMIRAVLPYLVIKREQAELVLAYRKTLANGIAGYRKHPVLPESVKQQRHELQSALHVLNKRGA